MWHAVSSVNDDYDPILYESPEGSNAVVLNAGPGTIVVRTWLEISNFNREPYSAVELRPGNQRIVGGRLIRAHLISGNYAAIGWRVLEAGSLD